MRITPNYQFLYLVFLFLFFILFFYNTKILNLNFIFSSLYTISFILLLYSQLKFYTQFIHSIQFYHIWGKCIFRLIFYDFYVYNNEVLHECIDRHKIVFHFNNRLSSSFHPLVESQIKHFLFDCSSLVSWRSVCSNRTI